MSQINDTIESRSIFGSFDLVDMVCGTVFTFYCFMSLRYSLQAFRLANHEYGLNKNNKNFNLYNLIFAETDFEITSDLSVMRFKSVLIFFISIVLLTLLFMPPRDEML
jgi:hypothetical protein